MIKLLTLKNKLRKPKTAKQSKMLAIRDFLRRQQIDRTGSGDTPEGDGIGELFDTVELYNTVELHT